MSAILIPDDFRLVRKVIVENVLEGIERVFRPTIAVDEMKDLNRSQFFLPPRLFALGIDPIGPED